MSTRVSKQQQNCLQQTDAVKQISQGLFTDTPIDYFCFSRIFMDGTTFSLSSDQDWLQQYFANHLSALVSINQSPHILTRDYAFWYDLTACTAIQLAMQRFRLGSGFTAVGICEDYFEFFHYCGDEKTEHLENWYLNNQALLKHFQRYFVDRSQSFNDKSLITKPDPTEAQLISKMLTSAYQKRQNALHTLGQFSKTMQVKQLPVTYKHRKICLSQRELDCLQYLCKGYTAKKAGQHLSLSPRTIETYWGQTKKKFNCRNKSELIEIINNMLLFN